MGSLGVAGRLHLLLGLLSEGNAEHADEEAIGSLGLDERLNQRVPLLDHRAPVISGDVHSVEVRVAVEVLDLLDLEPKLPPGSVFGALAAISKRDFEDTVLEVGGGVSQTRSLVHRRHGDAALLKARSEDVVPLLLGEGMHTEHC